MSNLNRLGTHIRIAQTQAVSAETAFRAWQLSKGGLEDSLKALKMKVEADSYLAGLVQAWLIVTGEEWAG